MLLWRHDHPNIENKSLCARECGIDVKTARKWWNCTAEDAKAESDRLNAIRRKGIDAGKEKREATRQRKTLLKQTRKKVNALDEESRKIYEWKVAHSLWPYLSNSMENAARDLDIPLETVRKLWNSVDKLYYDPDMVNGLTTSKDFVSLTKLFEPNSNYSVDGYTHKQTVDIVTSGKWKELDWNIVME